MSKIKRKEIPWLAVSENYNFNDILNIVKFLLPFQKDKKKEYELQLKKVKKEFKKLSKFASVAKKLTLGDQIKKLEEVIKKYLKVKYVVFLTNATAGLEIAYKFAGLKPQDEVIIPAITFIASVIYPLEIGAKIILADIDPKTLNIDPKDVEKKITKKTKVIMPVHLGGYPADMNSIIKLAKKYNITVIEDAAHAFGARYEDKMVGTIGDFGVYSFHEKKNITSFGEGGILVTNNPLFGREFSYARFLGINGSKKIPHWIYDVMALQNKNNEYFVTSNYSPTEIQALGLKQQFSRIEKIIDKRKEKANFLNNKLKEEEGIIIPPLDTDKIKSAYHLYLLQIDPFVIGADIQVLKEKLYQRGIPQIPHFAPLYKFSILKQLGYDTKNMQENCPKANEVFQHYFTHLPLHGLSKNQLFYIAEGIISAVKEIKQTHKKLSNILTK